MPSPWASPRGQARGGGTGSRGRGRSGLGGDLRGAPGSTPGHRTGLQTAGREARESAPRIRVRASLSPTSPGPLRGTSRVPPFLGSWETSPATVISPPGSFSLQPERVPPQPQVPTRIHRAFGWTREKQRGVETRGGGPRAPGEPELRLARRPVARRREETWGAGPARPAGRSRAGAVPYLRGSCRGGRRESARIPGLVVLPLSPYPSIQLGLLPLASPWKKSSGEKEEADKSRCRERACR